MPSRRRPSSNVRRLAPLSTEASLRAVYNPDSGNSISQRGRQQSPSSRSPRRVVSSAPREARSPVNNRGSPLALVLTDALSRSPTLSPSRLSRQHDGVNKQRSGSRSRRSSLSASPSRSSLRRKHVLTFDDIEWDRPTKPSMPADEMETKKLCLPYQSELSYIQHQIEQRLQKAAERSSASSRPRQAWNSSPSPTNLGSAAGPLATTKAATTSSSSSSSARGGSGGDSDSDGGGGEGDGLPRGSSPAFQRRPQPSSVNTAIVTTTSSTAALSLSTPPGSPTLRPITAAEVTTVAKNFVEAKNSAAAAAAAARGNQIIASASRTTKQQRRRRHRGRHKSSRSSTALVPAADAGGGSHGLRTVTEDAVVATKAQASSPTDIGVGDFDADSAFRRAQRSFSLKKCLVDFSKFCARIPPPPSGEVRPQLRRLTWVLPLVESIYDKRWQVEVRHAVPDTTVAAFSMPLYAYTTLADDVGLPHMVHQACWDLVYSVIYYRDTNEELETFANFLAEVYNADDLMIFLHARALVQRTLGVNLKSKHKRQDAAISKLFLPRSLVPRTEAHPELREGTRQVYLTRTACFEVAEKLFQNHTLAAFFVKRDVDSLLRQHVEHGSSAATAADISRTHPGGSGRAAAPPAIVSRMQVPKFLEVVLLEFRSTPQALVEFLKYGDVAKNIEALDQLQQSSEKEVLVSRAKEAAVECTAAMRRAQAALAKIRSNPPRKVAQMAAHKVQLRIAQNRFEREKRKVKEARAAVKMTEEETSGVWHKVLRDSKRAKDSATLELQHPGPTPPVTAAIVRLVKHMQSLYDKHRAGKTMMEAYAETWRDQLRKLQEKYAKFMMDWIRRKRREKAERAEARRKLEELRMLRDRKRAYAELELMRAEEERMQRYFMELAKLQAEMDAEAHELYLRKMRARRRAWADERFLHRQRLFTKELIRRWKIFRICGNMRRLRIKRTLAYYFGAPEGWLGYHLFLVRARRAAVKLQVRYRMVSARRRMDHIRAVFGLEIRVQRRTLGNMVAEWRRVAGVWKSARLLARRIFRGDYRARFGQWRRSIAHQRWQVKNGVTKLQAVTRGGMQRWRRKKLMAVKVLQGFSRTYLAQSVLAKVLRRKNRNQLVARKYLRKLMNRLLQRSMRSWAFVTRRAQLVRRKFLDHMRADMHERFRRWRRFLGLEAEERRRSASKMQSMWRARAARMLVGNIRSLNAAVRRVQRVYRGMQGRRNAAWQIAAERAALKIAARWRGYRGRSLFTRLKLMIVLEDMREKRYKRVKEHFQYDRAWLLDDEGNNLLMIAAKSGSKRLVKICLRNGMDPASYNKKGKTALHLAACSYALGSDKVTDYLCEKGLDVNFQDYKGWTPLMDASDTMSIPSMKTLLQWGADPSIYNEAGHNALLVAVLANRPGAVRALCETGADPNVVDYEYRTPLHHVAYNDLDLVGEVLVEFGADTAKTDPEGYPPLHYAAVAKNLKALDTLLRCGANPDYHDRQDWAVLHHAANGNAAEVASMLCAADADVDVKDRDEDTPLHVAIAGHHNETAELLLGFGANVNAQNADGMTPLHIAARENNVYVAEQLMTYDLAVNTRDYQGHTALGVARLHTHMDVVRVIENRFETQLQEAAYVEPDDEVLNRWEKRYDEDREEAYFFNTKTEERRTAKSYSELLGSTSSMVRVLEKRLLDTKPGQDISAADYADYFEDEVGHITREKKREKGARLMQALWRRFKGRHTLAEKIREYVAARKVQSRWRGRKTYKTVRTVVRRREGASTIQRCWRKFTACRMARVVFLDTQRRKLRKEAATTMQRVYRGFVHGRRVARRLRIRRDGPQSPTEWEAYVRAAKDERITDARFKNAAYVRTVGVYEEYYVMQHPDIRFYRHTVTGVFSWDEPAVWASRERLEAREFAEQAATGFTQAERRAAVVLQNRYRGKRAREKFRVMAKGVHIMMSAEDKYLRDPHNVVNMCNYMLFLLCFKHAYDRVRPIAAQCVAKMEERGPDVPFVLYTHAIFLTATAEEDWLAIRALVARAVAADPMGNKYDAAFEGFFRRAKAEQKNNATALFHFAIASMLVRRDYDTAEACFLRALENMSVQASMYDRIITTFDYMLQELMGQPNSSAAEKWRVYAESRAQEHWEREKKTLGEHVLLKGITRLQAVARKLLVYARIDDFHLRYSRVRGPDGVVRRWLDADTGDTMDERPPILESAAQKADRIAAARKEAKNREVEAGRAQRSSSTRDARSGSGSDGGSGDRGGGETNGDTAGHAWEEHVDDDGVTPYFFNPVTGESRWERPPEMAVAGGGSGGAAAGSDAHSTGRTEVNAGATTDVGVGGAEETDNDWEEHVDEDGVTPYYYNKRTGESRWQRPLRLVRGIANIASAFQAQPEATAQEPEQDQVDDAAGTVSSGAHSAGVEGTGDDGQWEEVLDAESNTTYFYNPSTGESRWDKPLAFARLAATASIAFSSGINEEDIAAGATADANHTDTSTAAVTAVTEEESGGDDDGGDEWEEVLDEATNSTYFYNPSTGESRWDRPLRMARSIGAIAAAFAAGQSTHEHDGDAATEGDTSSNNDNNLRSGDDADEWEEHVDEAGYPFYFNAATGESKWEQPIKKLHAALAFGRGGFYDDDGAAPAAAAAGEGGGAEDQEQQQQNIAGAAEQSALPADWEVVLDGDGYEYYYNTVTGVSQYEYPEA